MKYRNLGRSGLKVSPLCLGTYMFGKQTDEPTAARIIGRARDGGVNFIDTADVYEHGKTEEIVGRAIKSARNGWVVATKVSGVMGSGPNQGGLSRKWIFEAAEASLRRLATDYINLYYLHTEDHSTPLAETVRAMGDLIRQGKVRYFGVSNYRSWRVAEICTLCDQTAIARPAASQPYYNAANRMPEVEHLPACGYYGLGVVPYSPLARGVLTGKYDPDKPPPPDTRAGRNDARMLETEWRRESLLVASKIRIRAEILGITAGQFALSWLLNNRSLPRPSPARALRSNGRSIWAHSPIATPRRTRASWTVWSRPDIPPRRDITIRMSRSRVDQRGHRLQREIPWRSRDDGGSSTFSESLSPVRTAGRRRSPLGERIDGSERDEDRGYAGGMTT